jgi:hypothetical protein
MEKKETRAEELAMEWLKKHYPDKAPIDIRWSAVINFAIFLDNLFYSRYLK